MFYLKFKKFDNLEEADLINDENINSNTQSMNIINEEHIDTGENSSDGNVTEEEGFNKKYITGSYLVIQRVNKKKLFYF